MNTRNELQKLKAEMLDNVLNCILPFWRDHMIDEAEGGFYGSVGKDLRPIPNSPKSLILNTRMLWAYSNAYRRTSDEKYKTLSLRSYKYIISHFWDNEYGGVYYMVSHDGKPLSAMKKLYGQACFLYAAAEYYDVFNDEEALIYIRKLIALLDSTRSESGLYRDFSDRAWNHDLWLDAPYAVDTNGTYSLNAHLHLLESIALIYTATGDIAYRDRLEELVRMIVENIVEYDSGHLKAGMDSCFNRTDEEINFGHDLECAYLMMDATETIGNPELSDRVRKLVIIFADNAISEGMDPIDGSINADMNKKTGISNRAKLWWVQCESISGFLCAYMTSGNEKYLEATIQIWNYIKKHMLCDDGIEWYGVGSHEDNPQHNKTELWWENLFGDRENKSSRIKCPYHNSRAMFGAADRIDQIIANEELHNL